MTNDNRTTLLYGFLFIASIHWAGIILTTLLNYIVGIFVEYDKIPWFRLVIVLFEIPIIVMFLNRKTTNMKITPKSLLKLTILSIFLFFCAQMHNYYDYTPGFCGFSSFDNYVDNVITNRQENLHQVKIIETFLLSLALITHILEQIKKSSKTT